jgi:hypothetical protein
VPPAAFTLPASVLCVAAHAWVIAHRGTADPRLAAAGVLPLVAAAVPLCMRTPGAQLIAGQLLLVPVLMLDGLLGSLARGQAWPLFAAAGGVAIWSVVWAARQMRALQVSR